MINLNNNVNQKINLNTFVEIFFYTFPLSFIIGNLVLTINSLIFAILSLVLIKKEKLTVKFDNFYWILVAFFLYLFSLTIINFNIPGFLRYSVMDWDLTSHPVFKSFLVLRYLLLFYLVNILITNKKIKIDLFFLSSLFCTSFVSADIIFQYITGFDIFGFENAGPKNPGPFNKELISGGYLEKFSFFSFFSFMYISENYKNKKFSNIVFIFIIAFHSLAILLSGNRMPLLLYLIGYFMIFFLVKRIRFVMTIAFIIFLGLFYGIIQKDPVIKNYTYNSFINTINVFDFIQTINKKSEKVKDEKISESKTVKKKVSFLRTTGHSAIYQTAYLTWLEQPFFGLGLKSFRIKCFDILIMAGHEHWSGIEHRKNLKVREDWKNKNLTCSTHPHNYYLELLVESGIIGTSLILLLFIIVIKKNFFILKESITSKALSENIMIPIFVVFFLEIFPFRSSGSFFTNWNATFFWIIVSFLYSTKFSRKKKIF